MPGATSVTNSIGVTTASPPPPDPTTTTTTTSGATTTTPSPPPPDPTIGAGAATAISSNAGQTVNTMLGSKLQLLSVICSGPSILANETSRS